MDKKGDRLTDKQILERICDGVDEIAVVIKAASRSVFDLLINRTIETFSDTFDKYKDKAKQKIVEKGSINDKDDNISE